MRCFNRLPFRSLDLARGTNSTAPARAARPPFARPPLMEALEGRRLLSTTVAAVDGDAAAGGAAAAAGGDQAVPLASYYGGTLSFGRVAGQPRRASREVVVNVTDVDPATGQVAGTLSAAGLGDVAFAGQVQDRDAFALTTTGGVTGTLSGRLRNGGSRMAGVLAADDGSTLRVDARALTPANRALAVADTGSAAAATNFTGSTTGSVSLRPRVDGLASSGLATGTTLGTGRQNYDLTLDITGQNADGTLTGTLDGGALGTYDVNGVASGNRLTLIATPTDGEDGQAGAAGVLRLTAVGNGSRFVGRFEQANGGTFAAGRINLARVATGGVVGADGSVLTPDGGILRPDGTLIAPDGTVLRIGTGTSGNVGTVGTIGTAPGATGAAGTNNPFGPIGTAPGATGAGVTNDTTFGLNPALVGSTGAFSTTGTFGGAGAFGSPATAGGVGGGFGPAGSAIGTPIYAAGSSSLGSPIYTYSPFASAAYTGTALGTSAAIGTPAGRAFGAFGAFGDDRFGSNGFGSNGFDVVGGNSSTDDDDVFLAGEFGAGGTGSGSVFR